MLVIRRHSFNPEVYSHSVIAGTIGLAVIAAVTIWIFLADVKFPVFAPSKPETVAENDKAAQIQQPPLGLPPAQPFTQSRMAASSSGVPVFTGTPVSRGPAPAPVMASVPAPVSTAPVTTPVVDTTPTQPPVTTTGGGSVTVPLPTVDTGQTLPENPTGTLNQILP